MNNNGLYYSQKNIKPNIVASPGHQLPISSNRMPSPSRFQNIRSESPKVPFEDKKSNSIKSSNNSVIDSKYISPSGSKENRNSSKSKLKSKNESNLKSKKSIDNSLNKK